MSDSWQELAEQLDSDQKDFDPFDLELNSCLLAMARYLLKLDRGDDFSDVQNSEASPEIVPFSNGSVVES